MENNYRVTGAETMSGTPEQWDANAAFVKYIIFSSLENKNGNVILRL